MPCRGDEAAVRTTDQFIGWVERVQNPGEGGNGLGIPVLQLLGTIGSMVFSLPLPFF
ncbi:MAG: hypothetical protein HC838_04500 [Spirulinaceae cyanobacterium RM2_2_10]|nr:hypothetical protein [Spirulinaceae cyanobacterium RM2_2_10]